MNESRNRYEYGIIWPVNLPKYTYEQTIWYESREVRDMYYEIARKKNRRARKVRRKIDKR